MFKDVGGKENKFNSCLTFMDDIVSNRMKHIF